MHWRLASSSHHFFVFHRIEISWDKEFIITLASCFPKPKFQEEVTEQGIIEWELGSSVKDDGMFNIHRALLSKEKAKVSPGKQAENRGQNRDPAGRGISIASGGEFWALQAQGQVQSKEKTGAWMYVNSHCF